MSHVWVVREDGDLKYEEKTNIHVTKPRVSIGALENKTLKLGS